MKNLLPLTLLLLMLPTFVIGADEKIDESIDGSFATPTNMTDKQMDDAKHFTHQGIKDQKIKEGCAKVNDCKEDENGFPLEMIIGKMYTMMGMAGAPTLNTNKVSAQSQAAADAANEKITDPAKKVKPETEKKKDVCIMVAAGYELVGGALQSTLQSKAQKKTEGINDPQLASLVNLKETHKARATTASWQRNIYAGVTACYGYMLATGAKADFNLIAKMSASAALMGLYWKKIDKHKDAAKKVQDVIDSLPKAGDCNPWTGTKCFCAEATSKTVYPGEYQEVCVLNNGNFDTPKIALGCGTVVDKKVSFDKECKCKATNTCIKGTLSGFGGLSGFGTNMLNEANKNFSLLDSGEFDQGKFDSAALSAGALAAKVKLPNPKYAPKVSLTPDQKKLAQELSKYAPPSVAAAAAASSGSDFNSGISDSSSSAGISKLSPEIKAKLADAIKVNYNKGGGDTEYSGGAEEEFTLPGFGPKKEEAQGGTEILSFADQAVSKADVSNAPDTPIFDIISNRYRRSAWNKLDTQGK